MSLANFVATPGNLSKDSSAEQDVLCTDGLLTRPKFSRPPRLIFVLDCVPLEHYVATSDKECFHTFPGVAKRLAKARFSYPGLMALIPDGILEAFTKENTFPTGTIKGYL